MLKLESEGAEIKNEIEEFSICKSDNESDNLEDVETEQIEKLLDIKPTPKSVNAAWTDDTDDVDQEETADVPSAFQINNKRAATDDSDDEEMISHKKVLRPKRSEFLPLDNYLKCKNLGSANSERRARSNISATEFNPKYQMLLVTSYDTSMSFFKLEDRCISLLRDRVCERFPIRSAKFTPDGEKVIFTSVNKQPFRMYDLKSGTESRASEFQRNSAIELQKITIDPTNKFCAFSASFGNVFIADLKTMEKLYTLQVSGNVVDLTFDKLGDCLVVATDTGDIVVYDCSKFSCSLVKHRCSDFGNSTLSISLSNNQKWLACGTNTGYVNLYKYDDFLMSEAPVPFNSLDNLVHPVNLTLFHPRNEMLAFASDVCEASLRLYHLQGQFVFQNLSSELARWREPTSMSFSPNGKYLCVGQKNGAASLLKLDHYKTY